MLFPSVSTSLPYIFIIPWKQKKIKIKKRIKLNHNIFIKIMQSFWLKSDFCEVMFGSTKKLKWEEFLWCLSKTFHLCALDSGTRRICYHFFSRHHHRVVKSSRLPAIPHYLVSIGRLLCLAFLYRWRCLNKISLDWRLTLTTQPSASKLSDNPASGYTNYLNTFAYFNTTLSNLFIMEHCDKNFNFNSGTLI